jgi:lipoyl(octanoyl) transferase
MPETSTQTTAPGAATTNGEGPGAAASGVVPQRVRRSSTAVQFVEPGLLDYQVAWDWQRDLAAARIEDRGPDTVLLLEHPPVYTAGRRTEPADLPTDGTPVVDVDRGGRITWHGPGQLVGYPVVALAQPVDVVGYVRLLEQALIAACIDLGLPGVGRIAGRSGVWLPADHRPERKIAAIGVRIAKGVTTHGFALNCDPDLGAFDRIVPCGIRDAGVTSLSAELPDRVGVAQALPVVRARLLMALDGLLPVDDSSLTRPAARPSVTAGIDWRLDPVLAGAQIGQDDRNAGALIGGQSAPGDRIRAGAATSSKELT